jgi:hypothetical protein
MRYCIGYEDKERVVDATGFQMGQSGPYLMQIHAVPVVAHGPAATTVCRMSYTRVNGSLDWFDPKQAVGVKRCEKCLELRQ